MTAFHRDQPALRTPREGSKLRRLYDLLLTGHTVSVAAIVGRAQAGRALDDLRDYYHCELEGRPSVGSRLRGRWDGLTFVPVERLPENCGAAQ